MQARNTLSKSIRAALVASASILALAGSGLAAANAAPIAPAMDLTVVDDRAEAKAAAQPSLAGDFYYYNDTDLVSSELGDAYGIYGLVSGTYDTATAINVGSIEVSSEHGFAVGIQLVAEGAYGEVMASNDGDIQVESGSAAVGILAYSAGKYAAVENTGDIDVVAISTDGEFGYAVGVGVSAFYGEATLVNDGAITVHAEGGSAGATGAFVSIYGGNAHLTNTGGISVEAIGDYAASAYGAVSSSGLLSAAIYNEGLVEASAEGGYVATAVGIQAQASEFGLSYVGDEGVVIASASAEYDARATGAYSSGLFANLYSQGGEISAQASADAEHGDARAYGAVTYGSFSSVYLMGDSELSASAEGAYALAVGSLQYGYFTGFVNEGSVEASATGETGFAIGVAVIGLSGTHVYNDGDIAAVASGDYVQAVGVFASSYYYGVDIDNTGSISATSDYRAVAVQLESNYVNHISNSGTIEAEGGTQSLAIYSTGYAADYIYNEGTITGSIWTGDGDDTIVNEGTIKLVDASIDLGSYSYDGNQFYNTGTISIDGDSVVDMGGPIALLPSANPYAFYNDGTIDLIDGEADDSLTIVGDLAGDGTIGVDVSGQAGSADQVVVEGNVVAGTSQAIDVVLLDAPEEASSSVAVVAVTGDSVAGNFTLGDVDWAEDESFLALDFSLVADIDASNATDDVFSLGIEVSGLSDTGALAASVAPSVQGLMNAQVGTRSQRAGAIEGASEHGARLWARAFQDKGSFSPDHVALDFGQGGNFDWSQRNSGIEAGVDFAVAEGFSLGLLLAQSQADTDLDKPGAGSADIDADTWGLYGTWISPSGFSLDASYRWMSFDVDIDSASGQIEASGDAEAFNVEAAYAWTLAGELKIEPQLQYTRTRVDKLAMSTGAGMVFVTDGGDSSRGRLGVSLSKQMGGAGEGWSWTPSATLSAVREFDGDNGYAINGDFHGATSMEGTSALLDLGFTAVRENWAVFGGLSWQDGGAVDSVFGGQLGVRYSFGAR